MKTVCVMGLDRFHLDLLNTIPGAGDQYQFLTLYEKDEIVHPPELAYPPMQAILDHAQDVFARSPQPVDGVMGYWDLPTSVAVPLVAHVAGLPGPPLEAVARCEHKYWSRLEQAKVLPEMVGGFQAINPFADDPVRQVELPYPFWLKPVKAHSSFLGFYIDDAATLAQHLPVIRQQIGIMARPMNEFLSRIELPAAVGAVDGWHCIAEELISEGLQCTLEGYGWGNAVTVFGVVDSIRGGRRNSSFTRYQYPSHLPAEVQQRMTEATVELMQHMGYRGAAFNVEFYWNPETDGIRLLEINARISQSHSPLFLMVDGCTNQKVALDLALGKRPDLPHRQGAFPLAAKFMVRFFQDGILERVPVEADIRAVQERFPEARIGQVAAQGTRLSDLRLQDSYSFEVATIFLGGDNEADLLSKYDTVLEMLDFRVRDLEVGSG